MGRVEPGERVGRYFIVRAEDGLKHAIALSAATAACEVEGGGALVLVGGGRMIRLEADFEEVLGWLSQ